MIQSPDSCAALLPSGLFDQIGANAESEAALVSRMMNHFRSCGYITVQPPLMEYASALLGAQGESPLAQRSFRVMDPLSGQMLAIRADMTMQIARIAGGALAASARPLRLCYAGQTVRTLPDTMRQTRQFRQIGIELFGADSMLADIEVMQLAIASLAELGIYDLTLDIALPQLLPMLLSNVAEAEKPALLEAIRHKDSSQLERLGQPLLGALCSIAYGADAAFTALHALSLPPAMRSAIDEAQTAIVQLQGRLGEQPRIHIILDPLEMRGFGYHSGLSFALYARGRPQELGRGGRYLTPHEESATGLTFYAEDILPLLSAPARLPLLLLPAHCTEAHASAWRAHGYRTIYALSENTHDEARSIGADYCLNASLNAVQAVQ